MWRLGLRPASRSAWLTLLPRWRRSVRPNSSQVTRSSGRWKKKSRSAGLLDPALAGVNKGSPRGLTERPSEWKQRRRLRATFGLGILRTARGGRRGGGPDDLDSVSLDAFHSMDEFDRWRSFPYGSTRTMATTLMYCLDDETTMTFEPSIWLDRWHRCVGSCSFNIPRTSW